MLKIIMEKQKSSKMKMTAEEIEQIDPSLEYEKTGDTDD